MKQNVRFQIAICSEKFKLIKLKMADYQPQLALICLIPDKPWQIHVTRPLLRPFEPLKPSRCIKASFDTHENSLNFPKTKGFRTKISMKLVYQYMAIFFNLLNHIKSSSFTTSRELRQQFAACSG